MTAENIQRLRKQLRAVERQERGSVSTLFDMIIDLIEDQQGDVEQLKRETEHLEATKRGVYQ